MCTTQNVFQIEREKYVYKRAVILARAVLREAEEARLRAGAAVTGPSHPPLEGCVCGSLLSRRSKLGTEKEKTGQLHRLFMAKRRKM